MTFQIIAASIADAVAIADFQVSMAMESEGLMLDSGQILTGVAAGLQDPSKGNYYLVETDDLQLLNVF